MDPRPVGYEGSLDPKSSLSCRGPFGVYLSLWWWLYCSNNLQYEYKIGGCLRRGGTHVQVQKSV